MCDIKRCRQEDVAVYISIDGNRIEICQRCWDEYGNLERADLVKLLSKRPSDVIKEKEEVQSKLQFANNNNLYKEGKNRL